VQEKKWMQFLSSNPYRR